MIRNERGFSLVELLITMGVFVLAIAAASNILTGLLTQFKQQSKIAESNIEGVVGLEMMRNDVEQAGYGLPWNLNNGVYNAEAVNDLNTAWDDTAFNDQPNVPRAIVTGRPAGGFQIGANQVSDVLVVKAASVSTAAVARKWTYIANTGAANLIKTWGRADEDLGNTDRVIVINSEALPNQGGQGALINNGGVFFTKVQGLPVKGGAATAFEPLTGSFNSFIVYGISDTVDPRMPFNRADYYVRQPAAGMPARCEPTTGNLYKGTINHADGKHAELPLLDCVGYMKVVLALDMNDDGTAGTFSNADATVVAGSESVPTATVQATLRDPALLRQRLKQVRIYIVAQEGQRDTTYQSTATINIPDPDLAVTAFTVPDQNYHWKVYSLVLTPVSMR